MIMNNITDLKNILRRNSLFANVPDSHIEAVVKKVSEKTVDAMQCIFEEGSKGDELYLIAEGKVKISKKTKNNIENTLSVLYSNDFFGELELIDGLKRSATATALDKSHLVIINRDVFNYLLKTSKHFVQNLLNTLAIRLRVIDETFVEEFGKYTESMNNKMEKLHRLVEATKVVNSTLNIDKLLSLILDNAVQTVKADRGTLYLLDENKHELWSKVLQGSELVEIRIPVGLGIAGKVAEAGEVINITDAYKDVRFNPDIDKLSGYQTKSILCMPMRNKDGKIVGVLQLLNKENGAFTSEDEEYINAFSIHATIAIENAKMAQEMVQSERLSTVGRMASTIIHDIKNPMSSIRLYAQLMQKNLVDEKYSKMAEGITKEIDRFVAMTQEILDFSRGVSQMNFEKVETTKLIEEVTFFIGKNLEKKNIDLIKNINYEGDIVLDYDKMFRVFYNIIGNAADAMPEGGSLTIQVFKDDNMINFVFKDSGIGMTEEVKSKIFEPFFTHGKKHGTGLGMAIVKRIVDDHFGKIEIESEPGKGTSIIIKLPANKS